MLQRPGSSWGFGALLKDTSVVVLKEERALVIHSLTNNPCPASAASSRTCLIGLFEMNNTSWREQLLAVGAELKVETSSRTLSAPGSDALKVFACSYHRYSELNAIFVKYTNVFMSNRNTFYILLNTATSVQEYSSAKTYRLLNTNKVGVYMLLSVFLIKMTQDNSATTLKKLLLL